MEHHCPDDSDAQVSRVCGRFGLISAAGELAAALGVVPWPKGAAEEAVGACFSAWLEQRGGIGAAEIEQGIAQVRAFLSQHGSSRFDDWHGKGTDKIVNRAGWRVLDGANQWEYYVLPSVFTGEMCTGLNAPMIARALAEKGLLQPETGYLERQPGSKAAVRASPPSQPRQRLYHFPAIVLADAEDEARDDPGTPGHGHPSETHLDEFF